MYNYAKMTHKNLCNESVSSLFIALERLQEKGFYDLSSKKASPGGDAF